MALTVAVRVAACLALAPLHLLAGSFEDTVRPFLDTHCIACHSESVRMADLRLDDIRSEAEALRHPDIWRDVLRMTTEAKMPPPGSARPPAEELSAMEDWILSRRDRMASDAPLAPRRVTARRLNRAEYNNTVRDLLHVDISPANSFPVDDSGYGFDNIGDVLSVSPLLMEKYLSAAGKLARTAIWERPRHAEPTRFRIQAVRDESNAAAIGRVSPFTADGSMRLSFKFPADGTYSLAFGAVDRRKRSEDNGRYLDGPDPPPRLMTLLLEGRRMATKAVEAAQYFDRSERVRHQIQHGERDLWLGFVDMDGMPMDPNADFSQRKVWVDYLEVNGPFDAKPVPLPLSHRRLLTCVPEGEEPWQPCAEAIIHRLASRAYRRPPTSGEFKDLMRLAERAMLDGNSFESALQSVVQAVLVAPQFLFRVESPAEGQASTRIEPYELASRLSYFLWSSMPDDDLFAAAGSGALDDLDGIRAQARRMLADPKASALTEHFAGQWLELRNLAHTEPDSEVFPSFDESLRQAMQRETELFFGAVVEEDRSVLEFLDSDFTFVNERLAEHYGIQGVAGADFERVTVEGDQRGGLLGQASILTISSYPTRTSPVLRGLWVMQNVLGQSPPPPPPDVPELEVREGELTGTLREQLEEHRSNEGCMSCHLVMDALGFGLENYDAIGRWRTKDGDHDLDTSGVLPGNHAFDSPAGLRRILIETEARAFARTLTKKLLTYALGRGVDRRDNPVIDGIQHDLEAADYRFSALIEGIVTSEPFIQRQPDRVTEDAATLAQR